MADIIRIRRRVSPGGVGAPATLQNAELAYNENDHTLYIGEGTGGGGGSATVIVPIAGQGLGSNTSPAMNGTAAAGTANTYARGDHIHPTDTSRAPLNSPALTGSPTSTTPTPGTDNSTKIATTAFVQSAISAVSSGVTSITGGDGVTATPGSGAVVLGLSANGIVNGKLATMPANTIKANITGATATAIDATTAQVMTMLGAAPLASPSFTGTPTTAATPANGDNTLKLATTAYVMAMRHDQLQVPTTDVPWGSKRITGLLDPSNPQDAATKFYVDGVAQGIDTKPSCLVATISNITLSGPQTIDGIGLVAGDRVLVKDQTLTQNNGIYTVAAGAWTRATDMDAWTELVSAYTFVERGTTNADSGWLCTVDPGGTLGTTSVTWTQFSGAGQITAGAGLTKTGNTLDVVGTAGRITVAADTVDIAATYTGQTSITTLGTITSGTWQGTAIALAYIAGLGTMATQNATAVAITGGTIDNVTLDGGTF